MKKKLLKHKGGFKREDKSHKLDFTLIPIPVLKRLAKHYTEGAVVHGKNNWMKSKDLETLSSLHIVTLLLGWKIKKMRTTLLP